MVSIMFSQNVINEIYKAIKDAMKNGIKCNEDYAMYVDLETLEVRNDQKAYFYIKFDTFQNDWDKNKAKAIIEIALNAKQFS